MKNIPYLILFILGIQPCFAQSAGSSKTLAVTALKQPVLTRESSNPIIHFNINAEKLDLKAITGTLGTVSINNIKRIALYDTDSVGKFTDQKMIGSVVPKQRQFTIPFNAAIAPGKHYLWLSIELKETANIKEKLQLELQYLAAKDGEKYKFEQNKNTFYLGSTVRKHGDDQVNTYRIPGIATTNTGALISVYDVRYLNSRDLPGHVDVGMSKSADGGKTWQAMKIIMDMGEPHENNGVGDPAVLFDPATKTIYVVALWSKGNRSIAGSKPGLSPDETGQLVLVKSTDDGLTWSKPVSITEQVKNPKWNLFFNGPGTGSVMVDGTLVFAAQYWDENKLPHGTIIYSKDHGQTWKAGIGAKDNTTESAVVETEPGKLMLNMRDNAGRYRSISTTTDFGQSWTTHQTSGNTLADPVCMGSLIKAKVRVKGQLKEVLFFSNVNSSKDRKDLTVKASLDLGETWLASNQLLIDERPSFGYSALTLIDENTLGLIYEGVRDLFFVRIPVSDVIR
ncbi:sialidase family protein [Pedobacter rhizosphaerae]|uniref:exo-alpha-sialidase n=1 Tax=Pedobacter rhizosphaerae TaxID=390241 RepID=A0A1H9USF4_9SPHI|nr:sialidase family protein [Pedobacter rhizosphaerae]SES12269.1 sialidase-1 [Pedobacter rhizosphaerae]